MYHKECDWSKRDNDEEGEEEEVHPSSSQPQVNVNEFSLRRRMFFEHKALKSFHFPASTH